MKKLILIAAFTIGAAFWTTPLQAQETTEIKSPPPKGIAVLSRDVAYATSKSGQYIQAQLKTISETINKEFEPEFATLRTQAQQLNAEIKALSPETLRTRTDLQRRSQELRYKLGALADWKKRQMIATEKQSIETWQKYYQEAVRATLVEKGVHILLPIEAVMFRTAQVDITKDVVAKIDAKVTTIPVNRVRVPRVPQQQQAAQAGAAPGN